MSCLPPDASERERLCLTLRGGVFTAPGMVSMSIIARRSEKLPGSAQAALSTRRWIPREQPIHARQPIQLSMNLSNTRHIHFRPDMSHEASHDEPGSWVKTEDLDDRWRGLLEVREVGGETALMAFHMAVGANVTSTDDKRLLRDLCLCGASVAGRVRG